MAMWTIGELAASAGVTASAIRYWERAGVLPPALRISGQRRYGAAWVARIRTLRFAQSCGLSLKEMRAAADASPREVLPGFAQRKKAESLRQLRLLERISACSCSDWTECLRETNAQPLPDA